MKFTHLRDDFNNLFATVATDGETDAYGVSLCSEADQFSRKKGRNIAANRLQNGYGVIPDSPRLIIHKGEELFASDVVDSFVSKNIVNIYF